MMRTLLFNFLTLLTLTGCAASSATPAAGTAASTRTFYWDANPPNERVTAYRIYSAGKLLGTTSATSWKAKRGATYAVAAVNIRGEGPRSSIKL